MSHRGDYPSAIESIVNDFKTMLNIIHTPSSMTVRQYARFEADQNVRLLFRRFDWLPAKWFTKQIEAFTTEFNKLFSPDQSSELYRNIDKLIFQNKLVIMQALAEAIHVHLVHKVQLDLTRQKIGMKQQPDEALQYYIEQVKAVSGIEIKTLDDVAEFREELERSVDKFQEMFREKEPVKGAKIMELFFIYCSILEINPSYADMKLTEFAELKNQAEERSRKIQDQLKKR